MSTLSLLILLVAIDKSLTEAPCLITGAVPDAAGNSILLASTSLALSNLVTWPVPPPTSKTFLFLINPNSVSRDK